jgi:hypothetical protein
MKNLSAVIKSYREDDTLVVNADTHKLEQKTRNRVKRELTAGLMADLLDMAEEMEDVIVTRMEKGIGIAFLTPRGYFPATIEITMKNTDLDVQMAAEEFAEKVAAKEAERAERMALKLEKMKADEIKREAKRAERAAKEAAKLAELEAQVK